MSSSYQTQYYSQQPDNNNLGLLTTGALAGGGLATVALLNRDKLVKDINKKPIESNLRWAISKSRLSNGGFIGSKKMVLLFYTIPTVLLQTV